MPSAPIERERSICPRSTALPIRALSKLLRTDASGVLAVMSPHSATTTPRCTTITAVDLIAFDHASAFSSFNADHPALTGSTRSHSPSGYRSAAREDTVDPKRAIDTTKRTEAERA